jgi:hypothetical protein
MLDAFHHAAAGSVVPCHENTITKHGLLNPIMRNRGLTRQGLLFKGNFTGAGILKTALSSEQKPPEYGEERYRKAEQKESIPQEQVVGP